LDERRLHSIFQSVVPAGSTALFFIYGEAGELPSHLYGTPG
jgi:hypothetical protein